MAGPQAFPAMLEEVRTLLAEQRDAILRDDADALPALSETLHSRLKALMAPVHRQAMQAHREAILQLGRRARQNETMIHCRQAHIQRALETLSQGSPALRASQSSRTYGAAGGMQSSSAARSRTFATA